MNEMEIEEKKKELFKAMDELIAKGVGINLAAQIALALVQEKERVSPNGENQ